MPITIPRLRHHVSAINHQLRLPLRRTSMHIHAASGGAFYPELLKSHNRCIVPSYQMMDNHPARGQSFPGIVIKLPTKLTMETRQQTQRGGRVGATRRYVRSPRNPVNAR